MATPNVVPRADQEGGLGTAAKSWGKLFIENPTAGGTAAATISNLDVDQVALDINANNTTANIIDLSTSTLTTGSALFMDVNNSATTAAIGNIINIDFDKSGIISSGSATMSAINVNMNDAATNGVSGSSTLTGANITLTNSSNQGTISQNGLIISCTGADAANTRGIIVTTEDGGVDFSIRSSADPGDIFTIATSAAGATTISTIDDDGHAADLTFSIDGFVKFDSAGTNGGGVEIENGSASGNAALLIDNDDADQIALDIDAANTTANVIDIVAGSLSGGVGLYLNTADGQTDIKIVSSADTGDFFSIATTANGATTMTTVDDDATAAHLSLKADGHTKVMVGDGDTAKQFQVQVDGVANPVLEVGGEDGSYSKLKIYEEGGTTVNDYFQIEVNTSGGTTIKTEDAAGADANLILDPDGELRVTSTGNVNLAADITGAQSADDVKVVSMGAGYHMIIAEVDVFDANTTDNGVIKQIGTVKIPQYAVIHRAHLIITELSNLGTYNISLSIGTNSGVSAGTAPANVHEIIGTDQGNSTATDNVTSAVDIALGSGSGNLKKIFKNVKRNDALNSPGELTDDHYLYILSSGTGNGTSDGTSGRVLVYVEYFGLD